MVFTATISLQSPPMVAIIRMSTRIRKRKRKAHFQIKYSKPVSAEYSKHFIPLGHVRILNLTCYQWQC